MICNQPSLCSSFTHPPELGWLLERVLPLCSAEPHCRVPAQGSSGLLEAAPPTTEMKFQMKFRSQMLNTQEVARRGMMCGYIIFIFVKTHWFYRELWFYEDVGSGLVLPASKLHAIKISSSYHVCRLHGRKAVSLFSVCYMTQEMGSLVKLNCN